MLRGSKQDNAQATASVIGVFLHIAFSTDLASSSDAKHVSVTYFLLLEVVSHYDFVCGEPQLYSRAMLSNVFGVKSNHVTNSQAYWPYYYC